MSGYRWLSSMTEMFSITKNHESIFPKNHKMQLVISTELSIIYYSSYYNGKQPIWKIYKPTEIEVFDWNRIFEAHTIEYYWLDIGSIRGMERNDGKRKKCIQRDKLSQLNFSLRRQQESCIKYHPSRFNRKYLRKISDN